MMPEVCVHYWRVNDRGTQGICLKCGKQVVYRVDLTWPEYKKQSAKAKIEVKIAMGAGNKLAGGRERESSALLQHIYRGKLLDISVRKIEKR